MKLIITKIKIFNIEKTMIREVNFGKNHFLILGDLDEPQHKDQITTTNALGKTLLLEMLLYMLCGSNKLSKNLKNIKSFSLSLDFSINDKNHTIKRTVGEEVLILDNNELKISLAKEILGIDRSYLHYIFNLQQRKTIIKEEPNKLEPYKQAINIFGLDQLVLFEKYYELDVEIGEKASFKKQLEKKIEKKDRNIIKDNIDKIKNNLDKIEGLNIVKIDELLLEQSIQEKNINKTRIELRTNIVDKESKITEIDEYLLDSEDINEEEVLVFFKKINNELGVSIEKKIEPIIKFHKDRFVERSSFLVEEKKLLEKEVKGLKKELLELSAESDVIYNKINENNELKELFKLQYKLSQELYHLESQNGYFMEIKEIDNEIFNLKMVKESTWQELNNKNIDEIKIKYRKYSQEILKKIYPEKFSESYFDIFIVKSKKINTTKYPIVFNFEIEKDASEGVESARNLIIDMMLFKFSNNVNFMAWDSSVFNGMNPEQVKYIVSEILDISRETNKQAIISINRYQLGEYCDEIIQNLGSSNILTLNLSDTLLNIDI